MFDTGRSSQTYEFDLPRKAIKQPAADAVDLAPHVGPGDIQKAATKIQTYVRRTPLVQNRALNDRFGTEVYLKLEVLQETGSFKVRGAFNKMLTLSDEEKRRGVVAVSGGNHAQAVAFAAKTLGCHALILMPEFTPETYVKRTRGYGADVELFPSLTDAFAAAKEYEKVGRTLVHPFDDRAVIAGQGTIGLEILEDVPHVTDVILSVGGGGMAAGVAAAIKATKPDVRIWGVETRGADSMAQALAADRVVELPRITSVAKTLGAQAAGYLCFEMVREYLEGVTVVEDDEALRELFFLLENAKVVTEPAASCTLAAAERLRGEFSSYSHVVIILCGGNTGPEDLLEFKDRL
ncbi:MAG TPA: threonine/serine dehydratase [Pyrinomonadaceae bacterium]|nr:threonine/serine dehydratase [Pyrinomonadaceae bacterium]